MSVVFFAGGCCKGKVYNYTIVNNKVEDIKVDLLEGFSITKVDSISFNENLALLSNGDSLLFGPGRRAQSHCQTQDMTNYELLKFYLPTDTIQFIYLSPDTLNKYGIDLVRQNYNILARYRLSFEDMNNLNYIIPFPPTLQMSKMNIYIPK
ncbi:MAG: hypothetical protein OEW75_07135 [Cyclobacteriaceae bacterium]|nr:hypothetical protein [Cyclobacteriaceae bacterium]